MALKASPQDQALLLDLQALDTKLQQLAHQAGAFPEHAELAELTTRAREVESQLGSVRGVLEDAQSQMERNRPVVATMGELTIDRPQVWAALCLLAVVLFLPLYLVARSAN